MFSGIERRLLPPFFDLIDSELVDIIISKFTWRYSFPFFENPVEIGNIVKTAVIRNFGNGICRFK